MTEDEMAGWHHQLDDMSLGKLRELVSMDVFEFEQTPGDSEGQGSLACCSPWD